MVHLSFRISDKAPADLVAHLVTEGFTLRPRAIRAMLSIETLRSDRWRRRNPPLGLRSKMRGKRLDQLCDDNVFYLERGKNGFLIVEGCNAAYCRTLTPVELIELGPS